MKHVNHSPLFIVSTVSSLLIQLLFFSILYFYPHEYALSDPLLRKLSLAEWDWYIAQTSVDILESRLLQLCTLSPLFTITIWVLLALNIKKSKMKQFTKILIFLLSITAIVIPVWLMNFYMQHCTLYMTLMPAEGLSLILLTLLFVRAQRK